MDVRKRSHWNCQTVWSYVRLQRSHSLCHWLCWKNAHILSCAYDAIGREEMKKFFYQDFIGIFQVIINSTKKELDISIDPQFEQFLCDFYTEALASCLINWFSKRKKYDKNQIMNYLILIFHSSIPNIVKKQIIRQINDVWFFYYKNRPCEK